MTDAIPSWLPIPGWEPYQVSDTGLVLGKRGRLLRQFRRPDGYLQVILTRQPDRLTRKVHSLVALAFLGPRPDGQEVRHLDGDPGNNTVGNLAYGTHRENGQDTVRHGRHPQASQTYCIHGHEFTPENTYIWGGIRHCRECNRARSRAHYRRSRS